MCCNKRRWGTTFPVKMKRPAHTESSEATEALRRYAVWLVAQTPVGEAQMAASRALAGAVRPYRRRWVVAVAVAGLLLVGNVGLAAVSESAVPGDTLYGLKRAYEQITGIFGNENHAAERLREAEVLLQRGNSDAALAATEEALAELEIDTSLGDMLEGVPVASADPELIAETEALVDLAKQIHGSAKDSTDRQLAIAALREQAARVAAVARANSQAPIDHPGQGQGRPDDPGRGQGPPGEAGQGQGAPSETPSATAPSNTSSQGNRP